MSRILQFFIVALIATSHAQAQSCNMYIPLEKGFSSETQLYTKAGKKNGTTIMIVNDVQQTSKGVTATIEVVSIASNGKASAPYYYTVECNNGTVIVDTRAAISGIPDPKFKDEGSCLTVLPSNLRVGHVFEDCKYSSFKKNAYFETRIINRKVTAFEKVTVAAGTFDAFVIEYEMVTHMEQGLRVEFKKHHKDWYVPGKGIVRSESFQPNNSYTPGDKPFAYSELVSIK